jgi:peptidoglycan-associated lipoprotein
MKPLGSLIFSALLMGLIAGCSSSSTTNPPDPSQSLPPEGGYEQTSDSDDGTALDRPGGSDGDLETQDQIGGGTWATVQSERRVFFALNSSLLDDEATDLLQSNVNWLANQNGKIIIEGHCDERGTREFNLALGQLRAEAVVRYLTSHGVDSAQIQAISYGKERPLVRSHSQAAWNKNRRAEIVVE